MENVNVTTEEFAAYNYEFDVVSDTDYAYNKITEKWDIPSIEWDGLYGRHWTTYSSEEEMEAALKAYREHLHNWVIEFRKKTIAKNIEKGHKAKAIREAKTLGGQFPILKQLLEQSR